MAILTYNDLLADVYQKHKITMDTVESFEQIIEVANRLVKEYEASDYIDFISIGYPRVADDYLMIVIYLKEKGSIIRDVGTFVDELVMETGLEYVGDVHTDVKNQTKSWSLVDRTKCYDIGGDSTRNPRVTVKVDATKSATCVRKKTGRMIPEYEFVCEDE